MVLNVGRSEGEALGQRDSVGWNEGKAEGLVLLVGPKEGG